MLLLKTTNTYANKIKLLIDGDILVYRMGFACQNTVDGKLVAEPMQNTLYLIKQLMLSLFKRFNTNDFNIYLTADDKSNFRFEIAKTQIYKGNRDQSVNKNAVGRPIHYEDIRKYLVEHWNAQVVYGIEADDALSIEQMSQIDETQIGSVDSAKTIIISLDKDLDMVPGWHYNFATDTVYKCEDPGTLELKNGNKKLSGTGLKWFYAQMLLGDSADNIPGIKGYGPVKVFKSLNHIDTELDLWEAVQDIYYCELGDGGITENRIYEIADLLWMQRCPEEKKSSMLKKLQL